MLENQSGLQILPAVQTAGEAEVPFEVCPCILKQIQNRTGLRRHTRQYTIKDDFSRSRKALGWVGRPLAILPDLHWRVTSAPPQAYSRGTLFSCAVFRPSFVPGVYCFF